MLMLGIFIGFFFTIIIEFVIIYWAVFRDH